MFRFRLFMIALLVSGGGTVCAQSFVDPSFEEPSDAPGRPSAVWWSYCSNTSADHLPGQWGVTRPAYHGSKFVGLVCRPDSTTECIGQRLDLLPDTDYYFSVWLTYSPKYERNGRNPGTLRVLGKNGWQPPFLLWTSPMISHENWQKYWVSFRTPAFPVESLFFQAYYSPLSNGRAGIMMDSVGEIKIGRIPQVHLGPDTVLCEGETLLLDVFSDSTTYVWQDGSTGPEFLVTKPGTYSVSATLNGITLSDEVRVGYRYIPEIDLGPPDTTLCDGFFIELNASIEDPEIRYLWQDGETEAFRTVRESGLYQVIVSNKRCFREAEIRVSYRDCELVLTLPNVMSPNGDGVNDAFVPVEIKDVYAPLLQIYNRWGKRVYEARSLDPAWEGQSAAGPVPEGVYYWIIQYKDVYGRAYTDKGEVLLVR